MIEARPSSERLARHVADGHWAESGTPSGVPHALRSFARRSPERVAVTDRRGHLTYAELEDRVARVATGLSKLGVGAGDAVVVQLPNWHEALVLHLAAEALGAVTVPVPPIYRARECRHIAALVDAKVVAVPRLGSFDYVAMYEGLRSELPGLRAIVVAGSDASAALPSDVHAYASLEANERAEAEVLSRFATDPDRIVEVGFTSGSTGFPKGALHTSNTLGAEHRQWHLAFGLGPEDALLVLPTVGHQIGFTMMRTAILLGAAVVFLERWEPRAAAELIEREKVTFVFTTPAFLFDLLGAPGIGPERFPSLRTWVLAGQVVTSALRGTAYERLPHVQFCPLFGMTEMGCVVMCDLATSKEQRVHTGRPQPGVTIDVRAPDAGEGGASVGIGEEGELVVSGPSLLLGYYKQPDATAASFTSDGFFRTGDKVRREPDGFVMITGRIKDLIKRGGESVSPEEVEEVVSRFSRIRAASVVGYPDERLGERVCLFVVPQDGAEIALADVLAFLGTTGLAKQKWPERLELIDELPRTSIGKVDKAKLRLRFG